MVVRMAWVRAVRVVRREDIGEVESGDLVDMISI